jgi:hypothetical protein
MSRTSKQAARKGRKKAFLTLCFFLILFFDPEDGGNMFLREILLGYTALRFRRC